jgi:peroxiredoxin
MKVKTLLISLILLLASGVQSQTIELRFPHFAGTPYAWIFFQGDRQDTVARGTIPAGGEVTLVVPERHKGYAGMSRWMLVHQGGGGLDLIINGEDFQVECLERIPSRDNIHFRGTRENPFMSELYFEKQKLLQQAEAMQLALKSYDPGEPLHATFQKEYDRLEKRFATIQQGASESSLYAAKFQQIVDFTMGIADRIYATDHERAMALNRFVTREMDWDALYTSGHWGGAIHTWIEMNVYAIQNDAILLEGTRNILSNIQNDQVYTDLAIQIVRYFTRHDKDPLLSALSSEVRQSGKLLHMNGALMVFAGLHQGDTAVVPEGITSTAKELYRNGAVVFFYDTDCGNCEQVKDQLIKDYQKLKEKGIRVISISSDQDPAKNNRTLSQLPWPDKLSDYLGGSDGENYKSWGVLGTPTLFVVNREGIITGRHVTLTEAEILKAIDG